jgi:hypothetical protein
MNRIRLTGAGHSMKASNPDVCGIKYCGGGIDHCAREVAIAAISGGIAARRDCFGANRSVNPDSSAQCGILIAAVTADSGDLGRRLINIYDICLISVGGGIGARLCGVEWFECSIAVVDQAPGEIAVATIAGAVVAGVAQE